jgi:molybdenum cofactor guanylyltransferase
MKLTGIILAGGNSSRMGFDKGLMEFKGRKLVEYPLHLLRKYCDELIISSNNPDYNQFGVKVIGDEISGKGPVSGIFTSLKKSGNEWNMVTGCDMPYLNEALMDELLENLGRNSGIVPVHQGFIEPLSSIYHKNLTDDLFWAIQSDKLSFYQILKGANITFHPVDCLLKSFPLLFRNFNTPGDILTNSD